MTEKYKRFMVFDLITYYPAGGLNDCSNSFDSKKEAIDFIKKEVDAGTYFQLLDRIEGVEIDIVING